MVLARLPLCLLLVLGIGLSACTEKETEPSAPVSVPDEEASARPAAAADVLRLLVWEGYAPPRFVEEFERRMTEKYEREVRLEVAYVDGSDDFFAPVRNRRVDVITISHHLFKDERFKYVSAGLVLPLDLEKIPNYERVIPALRETDGMTDGEAVVAVAVCHGPYGLAYNTALVDPAPESWDVLWDPRYRGKYTLGAREYVYNANITALAMGLPLSALSDYESMKGTEFRKKLRRLAEGARSFWVGQDTADDLAGLSVAAVWGDSLGDLRRRGEQWEFAAPKEGTPCWIDAYAITWALADQPFLKTIAEEWIDRTLEPDFQVEGIVHGIGLGPVVVDLGDQLTPEEAERLRIGTVNSFGEGQILQSTMSERDRNGLQRLWEEARRGVGPEGKRR